MRLATGSVALRLAGDSIAIAAPSGHLPYLAAGTSAVLAPTDTTIHYREPALPWPSLQNQMSPLMNLGPYTSEKRKLGASSLLSFFVLSPSLLCHPSL